MTSVDGVVWCWAEDSSTRLYIFREGGQEITIDLPFISSDSWYVRNPLHLYVSEREFIKNLKQELNLK